tara:strand:- start:1603 stop:2343 length:741 start_codon:yes stop_codon:yes gene_type:complete
MSKFFQSYPYVNYNFGNNENPVFFQNLTTYVDMVDAIKDDTSFYEKMHIEEYERPDTLSYKLYGTTDYYWTFFLLNDDIRLSGWPLSNKDLVAKAKLDYPHQVITTEDLIGDIFLPGELVTGIVTNSNGIVIKRYIDLGQIIIDTNEAFGAETYGTGERIRTEKDGFTYVTALSTTAQYNSVHHYEDAAGNWVDINPHNQIISAGTIPITYLDRMFSFNDELKQIKILKPDVAAQVASNFKRSLLS